MTKKEFQTKHKQLTLQLRRVLYAWRPWRIKENQSSDFDDIFVLRDKIKRLEKRYINTILKQGVTNG